MGNAAANGSVAVTSTEPSLELAKTADDETVNAGDPIGFRIDLTSRGTPGQGRIIIENRAYPVGIGGNFSFTGDLAFQIASPDRATTFKALSPGRYEVTQATRPPNIELQTLNCNESGTRDSTTTGTTATIQLQAGETVRCIYTNRLKVGRIIIENRAYPVGIGGNFSFTGDLAFQIASPDRATTFKALSPGRYEVTQATRPPNIELQTLNCNESGTRDSTTTGTTATIQLQAGETVRCIYTNRLKVGRIIIENRAYPVGIGGNFSFTGDLAFQIASPDRATTFKALSPGRYEVTQATRPPNIELQTLNCNESGTRDSTTTGTTATIQLQAGETVRCIYTNANVNLPPNSRGRVVIEKQAPAVHLPLQEPSGNFEHNFSGSTALTGLIASGNDLEYAVEPGTYRVSEIVPSLDQFVSLDCDDTNSETDSRTATIRVEANEIVRCVWVNRDSPARVVIEKQAPAVHLPLQEPSGNFEHNFSGSTALTGLIASGNDLEYAVEPGTYRVSEIVPSLDQFVSLDCDDTNSETDSRTATIRVEANEIVRCVWVNRDSPARVVIEKQAPAVHLPLQEPSGNFEHNFSGSTALTGLIASGNDLEYAVEPDTYRVSEIVPSLDQFVSLDCDDANSETDSRTATIRVEANEIVRCVWVNTAGATGDARNVTLTDDLPAAPSLTWSLDPAVAGCSIEGRLLSCSFGSLADGQTVSVHVTSRTTTASCGRHDNTAVARADNRTPVQASASVTVICPAMIIVRKVTVPSPDATDTSFGFTTGGGLSPAAFTLKNGESRTFTNLVPGAGYSVAETTPAGWDLTSVCSGRSTISNIDVAPGETVTCTFTNTKRGLARVVKTVRGTPPSGSQSFCFDLRSGASTTGAGTVLESQCATAGNGGLINFSTTLGQGTAYALCEIVMPGWMTTLGPSFYVVYNPSGDNSTVCTDFRVDPGQTRTVAVDNIPPPSGLGRTIGFWKNWASCAASKGKQKPVLDQTLAAADPAGVAIGTLTLHGSDCLKGVRLLDKSTLDTGKKMASDPAFGLAAQLLAAKLNIVAGAGSCPAAVSASNDAQTLLASIHFNEITHDKLSAAQAAQANSLAMTLDRYNNNLLC